MPKEKQIQIPAQLYNVMAMYILDESFRTDDNFKYIEKEILKKIDRQLEHELYTKYKCAPSQEEKEKARKEYLDKRGIHHDFRW